MLADDQRDLTRTYIPSPLDVEAAQRVCSSVTHPRHWASVVETFKVIGRRLGYRKFYGPRVPLTEARQLMLGSRSTQGERMTRPTFAKHLAAGVAAGIVRLEGAWLVFCRWDDMNVSTAELRRRKAEHRAKGRARTARSRAASRVKLLYTDEPKNDVIPATSAPVTPEVVLQPSCRPAKSRASALLPGLHCARMRCGGGARPPWASRWGREIRKAPPHRPFTDTELDAFQDEFDRLDAEQARPTENLAGDPPAAPGPQPPVVDAPVSPSKAAEPVSATMAYFLALGERMAERCRQDGVVAPQEPAREPQRPLPVVGEPQARPAPVAPTVAPSVATPKVVVDLGYLAMLEQHHGVRGFNRVAAVRLGVSRHDARLAFEVAKEARGKGRRITNPCGYILGTMRRLHHGWACAP